VLVTNEGNFDWGHGTVTYYDPQADTAFTDVFQAANGRVVGNVLQSVLMWNDRTFLVVNNSGRIEVCDRRTLKSRGAITGLASPRYAMPVGQGRALVTDLAADRLHIVDLDAMAVVGSIPLVGWSERMVKRKGQVWVANRRASFDPRPGGYTLYAVDTQRLALTDSLTNPQGAVLGSLAMDSRERLWVAQRSGRSYGIALWDVENHRLIETVPFADSIAHIQPDAARNRMLVLSRHLWAVDMETRTVTRLVTADNALFYSFAIHPESGAIYVSDALNYVQRGLIRIYEPDGKAANTFQAGVIPGDFCFLRE
jgi:hypothetical protein